MRTARRALATTLLTTALAFGAMAPTASAAPQATAVESSAKHVSAWLCVAAGGHVVHYPGFKICIGGVFHGRLVL